MPRQFFSGNSIEQAVMSAARHYEIEPERLAYKLRDKKHGFLNIRRRVVIEVDPDNLELAEQEEVAAETASPPEVTSAEEKERPREPDHGDDDDQDDKDDLDDDDDDDDDGLDDDDDDEDDDDDLDDDEDDLDDDDDDDDDDDLDNDDDDDDDDDLDDDDDDDDRRRKPSRGGRGGRGSRGGRGGRGRGRGRQGKRERRRDVDVEEFFWNDEEDGWDVDDVEPGESQELTAVELCVERILDVMDLEIEYTITEDESIDLDFSGEDAEFLTEDNGKVLKAIEQIVPRMVRGLIGRSIAVNADCDGFRADHENSLRDLAEEAAEEVVKNGKPKTLSPMNPADRRIVHLALVEHPDVETVSQGHGFMKRVKVLPSGS